MKKLRLIGVHSQKEELLRELMLLGCVEVSDPAGRPDREELAAFRRPDGGKVWQKRSEQTTIVNALRLLDKHAPAKKGLLTPKPEVECAKLLDESALAADLALAGEILSLDAEARSLLTRASRERASAEAMTPWTALNVPLERMETQSCEMQLGTLPAAVPMEEVNAALSELEVSFDLVSEDKTSRYVSLLFRREDREAIAAALRPYGVGIAQHGISGTDIEKCARFRKYGIVKGNVATLFQNVIFGIKMEPDTGNAVIEGDSYVKEADRGIPVDLWDEIVAYCDGKGMSRKSGDYKKANLPFCDKILALPDKYLDRILDETEYWAERFIKAFNAEGTAEKVIEVVNRRGTWNPLPERKIIADRADFRADTAPTKGGNDGGDYSE